MEQFVSSGRNKNAVKSAFLNVHAGRSTDDLIIDNEMNQIFLAEAKARGAMGSDFEINWCLFTIRKSANLGPVVTARSRYDHDAYLHAAEIAARHVEDTHSTTVDRILCDPMLRSEFDQMATKLAPGISEYLLRKAALKLRKGRQLQPELTKRVANWNMQVKQYQASDLENDTRLIPLQPGIYLFFDQSGYLYIGETGNLRKRVSKHLDHSDQKSLARYLWKQGLKGLSVELHAFDAKSDGRLSKPRRAYEADLIRSRKPRFNIKMT